MLNLIGEGIITVIFYPILFGPARIWAYIWDRIEDRWWRHIALFGPALLLLMMPSATLAPVKLGLNLAVGLPAAAFGHGPLKTIFSIAEFFAGAFVLSTVFGGPIHLGLLKLRRTETTHGTASWGSAKDAKRAGSLSKRGRALKYDSGIAKTDDVVGGGLMLGRLEDHKRVPDLDPRYRVKNHVLTFAPTGAGKGIGCVIPNLLEYPGSVFCLDVKGENFNVAGRRRRELGQAVHVLDPFGVTGIRPGSESSTRKGKFSGIQSARVNWLDWIDVESPEAVSDSASLVDTLVLRNDRHESYWDDAAATLLQGLVLYVAALPSPERHLGTLRKVLTRPGPELEGLLKELGSEEETGFGLIARAANTFLAKADRERSGVLSVAQQHTAFLDDPRVVETLRESTVDFRGMKASKVSVFLALPPDKLRAYNRYTRLVLGQALKAMMRPITAGTAGQRGSPGKPEHNVLFLLDEFAQLGRFTPVEEGISILRGYGGWLWLLVQDLSQLAAVYPKWRSFLANSVLQAFGTQDHDTARYISDALGQETIRIESKTSSSTTSWGGHDSSGDSTNIHNHGRALRMPDEIRRMCDRWVVVLEQGMKPFRLERLDYRTDKECRKRFDENPMHRMVG